MDTAYTQQRTASINRALDRAHDAARAGNVPTLVTSGFDGHAINEIWVVTSRSSQRVYHVTLAHDEAAITTTCTCPAAIAGSICFHRALVRLAHTDAIRSRNAGVIRYRPRVAR